jgi:predicted RNA-binding Zn ribbon-like protein
MALGRVTVSYGMRFDSGRVCLDLLATRHPEDRLCRVEPLRVWITGSGLVPEGTPLAHVDGRWLPGFRELRDLIGQLVPNGYLRDSPYRRSVLARVNELARGAPPAPRAVSGRDGSLVRALAGAPRPEALLGAVARDVVELLTDPVARACLRQCEGDNCPIVYLDTSRGRRRRWCSSEVCGNRERVARHRRRVNAVRA